MNKDPLKTLARCAHLRSLILDTRIILRPHVHGTIVSEFISDHVKFMNDKGGSRLESIKIRLRQPQPILIDALGQLKSLVSLQLYTEDLTSGPFARMFAALRQGCHRLADVVIRSEGVVPNRVFYELSAFPNLTNLIVQGNMSNAQFGLVSLQRCRRLELFSCHWPINDDIRSMLLENILGLGLHVHNRSI
ncbi:hypothetical protein K492DRAFT_200054 [Lichtheimia hyalospora FSU 10163]|nr:hypothetical protein K492DRAFT_200054 [Lichtheimia hyalospora FSU 10163]